MVGLLCARWVATPSGRLSISALLPAHSREALIDDDQDKRHTLPYADTRLDTTPFLVLTQCYPIDVPGLLLSPRCCATFVQRDVGIVVLVFAHDKVLKWGGGRRKEREGRSGVETPVRAGISDKA